MKTINAIDLLRISEDYIDMKVKVCLLSLAYQMGKEDKDFMRHWNKRNTQTPHLIKWGSMPLSDFVSCYAKNIDEQLFLAMLEDIDIVNCDSGMVVGANTVGKARGLAYDDCDEVYITVKGCRVIFAEMHKNFKHACG